MTSKATAQALLQARAEWRALSDFPGQVPRTLAEAYEIQDHEVADLSGRPLGWKVGTLAPEQTARLGVERFSGPLRRVQTMSRQQSRMTDVQIIQGGFAAVEAELLIQLARPFRSKEGAPPASEIESYIGALHAGLEIAGSPLAGIGSMDPLVSIADHGNSLGVVVADFCLSSIKDLRRLSVEVRMEGEAVGQGCAADVRGSPVEPLTFLLANLAERGIDAEAGDWVSTGAITGVHPIAPGQQAVVVFGAMGIIAIKAIISVNHT